MTYGNHLFPRDRCKSGFRLFGDFAGSLSDILERLSDSMLVQAALPELIPREVFCEIR